MRGVVDLWQLAQPTAQRVKTEMMCNLIHADVRALMWVGEGRQAVMASRMGARVAMVACLGEDSNGASYLDNLSENGVDCCSVRRTPEANTGIAQLCVEDSG